MSITIPAGTAAASGGDYVTFVARVCPSYSDIYANADRSDRMQSLQKLDPDGRYGGRDDVLVAPAREDVGPQLRCRPLRHWRFTFGRAESPRAAIGAWGALSRVAEPYATAIVTRAAGAVTIRLNGAELSQAQRPGGLWVQGGLPNRPVPVRRPRGGGAAARARDGFGVLRCATDQLDGGNAERVIFPAGVDHVFCYAYYVAAPPAAATIVIRERVQGAPPGAAGSFPFSGDLSYASPGFTLQGGGAAVLHRAAGVSWQLAQARVADYKLTSIACRSTTGTIVTSTSGRTLSVAPAAGDTVQCVFVDRWSAPGDPSLRVVQVTQGGTGGFGYLVAPYNDDPTLVRARSRRPGVPVNAGPERNLALLATTTYFLQVLPPARAAGRWKLVDADCGGHRLKVRHIVSSEVTYRLVFASDTICTFTSRLIPTGSIRLRTVTAGGTGSTAFVIRSLGSSPRQYDQQVTTTRAGVAAPAAPDTPSDGTTRLPPGAYVITEQAPLQAPAGNRWRLARVTCNGHAMRFRQGSVIVRIRRHAARVSCEFADRLQSEAARRQYQD